MALPICFSKEISLSYDPNGNLVDDGTYTYEYDSFNQLVKIKESSSGKILTVFSYAADGKRIKKTDYANSITTTYYVGDGFVRVVNSSGVYDTVYYYQDGALVASKGPEGARYYLSDHLGSVDVVTDGLGRTIQETDYRPFGSVLKGGGSRFTFGGKEKDSSGLMYFGARYYSPTFGKFTQPDTIIQDIYDPQSLNRYAYARNNPLSNIDPSGNFVLPLLAFPLISGTITAGVDVIMQILYGRSIFEGTVRYGSTAKSFAIGAAAGLAAAGAGAAVGPALSGATGFTETVASGGATVAAVGMAGASAAQTTSNVLNGEPITNNILDSSIAGAKIGGVIGSAFGAISSGVSASSRMESWSYKIGPVATTEDASYYRYYGGGSRMDREWLTPFNTESKQIASRELAKIVSKQGTNPYTRRGIAYVPAGTRVNIGYNVRGTPQIEVIDDLAKVKYAEDINLK